MDKTDPNYEIHLEHDAVMLASEKDWINPDQIREIVALMVEFVIQQDKITE